VNARREARRARGCGQLSCSTGQLGRSVTKRSCTPGRRVHGLSKRTAAYRSCRLNDSHDDCEWLPQLSTEDNVDNAEIDSRTGRERWRDDRRSVAARQAAGRGRPVAWPPPGGNGRCRREARGLDRSTTRCTSSRTPSRSSRDDHGRRRCRRLPGVHPRVLRRSHQLRATAQGAGIPPPSTAPTDHKGHAMGTRMARLPAKVR
jgi:hypothetical protein